MQILKKIKNLLVVIILFFRVRIESDGLMDMSIALLINDDLYAYSKELAEQEEE